MNSCSDLLCCLSALYSPSVSLSVSRSLSATPPLLSALLILEQFSCHKPGIPSPPVTWLLHTTTWGGHLNLHQKSLGSPRGTRARHPAPAAAAAARSAQASDILHRQICHRAHHRYSSAKAACILSRWPCQPVQAHDYFLLPLFTAAVCRSVWSLLL